MAQCTGKRSVTNRYNTKAQYYNEVAFENYERIIKKYNLPDRYWEAYYARVVTRLYSCMRLYYFHPENSKDKSNSFEMLLKTMFPSKRQMINRFPELHEKPWLLPLCWLQRFVRASKYESSSNRSYVAGSLKISKRRIELLKKYDIL